MDPTIIPKELQPLLIIPFLGCGCCLCSVTIKIGQGLIQRCLSGSPDTRHIFYLFPFVIETLVPPDDHGQLPLKMVALFLACWSFGTRSLKQPGRRHSWKFNGTLSVYHDGSVPPLNPQSLEFHGTRTNSPSKTLGVRENGATPNPHFGPWIHVFYLLGTQHVIVVFDLESMICNGE